MEEEVFNEITTAKIDAKLHTDILAHEDRLEKILIIVFCVLLIIFRDWIGYWLKFGVAIPSGYVRMPINTFSDPVQTNYTKQEQESKIFTYTSILNNHKIKMIPQAHYELSGSVAAYNYGFLLVSDFFDSAALYDLGVTWGKLADKNFYNKYFKCYSDRALITGSRTIYTTYKTYYQPLTDEYIQTHFSHSHIVPANRNIMAAMLKLKKWDKVKIEGELVDMEYQNPGGYTQHYKTSLSRSDTNDTSRGYGANETIYVTSVQIGHYIYK